MKYIKVILFDNNSGGNIQLNYLFEFLSKNSSHKKKLVLFKNKSFLIKNFIRFIYVIFINSFHKNKYKVIYSDPLLTFLEFLPNAENITRFIQSIDEDLYINHPKMPPKFPSILKIFIRIANKFGKNKVYVCSKLCQDYIHSFNRLSKFIKPTIKIYRNNKNIKQDYNHRKIISIMSNPILKGLEIYTQMSMDFPNYQFFVITNKLTIFEDSKNLKFINPSSRKNLFELLSDSFCHISCSDKETIGLPLYEAMASSIPSIFKVNNSNIHILNKNLLSFDVYKKEILEKLFNKCKNEEIRISIISAQHDLIKKLFNVQHYNY